MFFVFQLQRHLKKKEKQSKVRQTERRQKLFEDEKYKLQNRAFWRVECTTAGVDLFTSSLSILLHFPFIEPIRERISYFAK